MSIQDDENLVQESSESEVERKKPRWIYGLIIRILFVVYLYLLYVVYCSLNRMGANIILILLILLFLFLIGLGLFIQINSKIKSWARKKEIEESKKDYLSEKEKFLEDYKKLHGRKRRIDYINLNTKYRKPIVRKCSNCGIVLAGFVKQCPNCGERVSG